MGSTDCGFVYLVRHCATQNDARNYPQLLGRGTPQALSVEGQRQAQILGEHFAKREIKAIYTSAMSAAIQTARAIRSNYSVPLTFCTSLVEANFGDWEGMTLTQVQRTPQHEKFLGDPHFPGGESYKQLCRRAMGYIRQLAETHAEDRIVVVSHEWLLKVVVCHLCGVPFDRVREIDQEPGRVSIVRVFRGQLELKAVNKDLAYVEEDLCDSSLITQ